MRIQLTPIAFVLCFALSCNKDPEVVNFSGNSIPAYNEIPTILTENYVNRIFIDLIGREPTDEEMNAEVSALEAADLSDAARSTLIDKLMSSSLVIPGDSSYAHAYSQKFYDDNKARFLDGIAESDVIDQYNLYYGLSVQDSILGNQLASELERSEADKLKAIMNCKYQIRMGQITSEEVCRRMCYNTIYDNLHMNSFNFINATFDDLFFRFPTDAEMDEAFEPIEQVPSADDPDLTGYLFGQIFSNKEEYLEVMTQTNECAEGMIRWAYINLLSREPSSEEVYHLMTVYANGNNIKSVQKSVLISDEYAGFTH